MSARTPISRVDRPSREESEPAGVQASLVEIFVSAQGEGPEVGRTTVFVRFGGCDLRWSE